MATKAKSRARRARRRRRRPADARPRLSAHPRASRQIREAKAWSGLAGFVLVLVLSLESGSLLFDAGVRALAAGAGFYVAGWALAVIGLEPPCPRRGPRRRAAPPRGGAGIEA